MQTVKIFMVDDHRTITDGLSEYFRAVSNDVLKYQVLGRVQSGVELLQRLEHLPGIDVILMDLEMPEMSGFELLEKALAINTQIPIIILTMHNSWSFAHQLVKKGARGYALKTSGGAAIVAAIKLVLQGKIYIDPEINPGGQEAIPVEWNPEDRQIICHILQELTSEQIGSLMGSNEEYVESRRRSIMRAIGARNMVGIVKYALQKKICAETPGATADTSKLRMRETEPASHAIKVFLVDDHALLLDSLEAMLSLPLPGHPPVEVVGKAHNCAEALAKMAALDQIDLVLLDKELPDGSGIDLIGKLQAIHAGVKCIMLSFDGSELAKKASLAAGASAFLVKTRANREAIVQTLTSVLNGGNTNFAKPPALPVQSLDPLDQQIIALLMEEQNNEAIAAALGISVSTVAHRRSKMMEKIGARSVVGLAVWAVNHGIHPI